MSVPEYLAVGGISLVLAKVCHSAENEFSAKQRLKNFCFVGEYQTRGDIRWFLSPLDNYEAKKLRVDEAVVEKNAYDKGVFLLIGDYTFRQYVPKEPPSINNISSYTRYPEEEISNISLGNSRQSSYFLSRSTTQGGRDTPSGRLDTHIVTTSFNNNNKNNSKVNILGKPHEGIILPPLIQPQKPSFELDSKVKGSGSFRLRRHIED